MIFILIRAVLVCDTKTTTTTTTTTTIKTASWCWTFGCFNGVCQDNMSFKCPTGNKGHYESCKLTYASTTPGFPLIEEVTGDDCGEGLFCGHNLMKCGSKPCCDFLCSDSYYDYADQRLRIRGSSVEKAIHRINALCGKHLAYYEDPYVYHVKPDHPR